MIVPQSPLGMNTQAHKKCFYYRFLMLDSRNSSPCCAIMGAARIKLSPIGVVVIGLVVVAVIYYLSTDGGLGEFKHKYFDGEDTISMKELLTLSVQLAERGGDVVRKIRLGEHLGEKSKGKTLEGANNPVTEGDMLSHKAMYYGFKKAYPKLNVVSEEHDHIDVDLSELQLPDPEEVNLDLSLQNNEDEHLSAGNVLVWIDPLDATQEYTENLVRFVTVMVCIAVGGKPVAGVIHRPFDHQTIWAWVGHGTSDHVSVPPIKESALTAPRIIVSRSHAGTVNATARTAFGSQSTVIPAGGAGYKVLQLFEDKADAYVHVTLIKKWDICAGDALLRTKGGKMTTLDGQEIEYGDKSQPANEKGLLAAIHNHAYYQEKLAHMLPDKDSKKL